LIVAVPGDILSIADAPVASGAPSAELTLSLNDEAENSGAVYVFRRAGTTWQQDAYLEASDTGARDFFGHNVALSGDTVAVAADGAAGFSGAVYVFRHTGTGWQQEAALKAFNAAAGDTFGRGLALSGDVFGRTGMGWQQEAYRKASNTGAGDNFGQSVALSATRSRSARSARTARPRAWTATRPATPPRTAALSTSSTDASTRPTFAARPGAGRPDRLSGARALLNRWSNGPRFVLARALAVAPGVLYMKDDSIALAVEHETIHAMALDGRDCGHEHASPVERPIACSSPE
jgi:hypothetical protein